MRIVIYPENQEEMHKTEQRTGKSASKIINEIIKCIDLGSLKFIERAEMTLKKSSKVSLKRSRDVDGEIYGKIAALKK